MITTTSESLIEQNRRRGYEIPKAVRDDLRDFPVSEAVLLVAYRRCVPRDVFAQKRLKQGHPMSVSKRIDMASDAVFRFIAGGVRATGTYVHEGHEQDGKRVPLDIEFLKAGAAVEIAVNNVIPDLLEGKHWEADDREWRYYRHVELDREAFFEALLGDVDAGLRGKNRRRGRSVRQAAGGPVAVNSSIRTSLWKKWRRSAN